MYSFLPWAWNEITNSLEKLWLMEKILNNNDSLCQKIWIKKKKSTSGLERLTFFFFAEKSLNPSCSSQTKNITFEYIRHIDQHKSLLSSSSLAVYAQRRVTVAIRGRNPATKGEKCVYTVLITLGAKNISYEIMPLLTWRRESAPCFFVMTAGSESHNGAITLWNLPPLCLLTSEQQGLGGKAAETGRHKNRPVSFGRRLDAAGPAQSFSLQLTEEGWKGSTGTHLKCRSAAVLYVIAATWRRRLLPTPILRHGTLYADTAHGAGVEMKWPASI